MADSAGEQRTPFLPVIAVSITISLDADLQRGSMSHSCLSNENALAVVRVTGILTTEKQSDSSWNGI